MKIIACDTLFQVTKMIQIRNLGWRSKIVIDASAEVAVLLNTGPEVEGVRQRITHPGQTLHVPHLFEIELLHALRSLGLRGTLSPERARLAQAPGIHASVEVYG